jgi:hypothetical protein
MDGETDGRSDYYRAPTLTVQDLIIIHNKIYGIFAQICLSNYTIDIVYTEYKQEDHDGPTSLVVYLLSKTKSFRGPVIQYLYEPKF